MNKKSYKFTCNQCNALYYKWEGKCSKCDTWDSLQEITSNSLTPSNVDYKPVEFTNLKLKESHNYDRYSTGMEEFDRVCGGGIIKDSAILIGGEPGIGKSTILMQIAYNFSIKYGGCYYISGEESTSQLQARAKRLNVESGDVKLATSYNLTDIIETIKSLEDVKLLIIDSIQTIYSSDASSTPGSISQIKHCSQVLVSFAKLRGIVLIIVGHVTRDGSIAGPKLLEHTVDTVLYFEGDKQNQYRMIRAVKNRFGTTDEVGIFSMEENGLKCVSNPSELFINQYSKDVSGTSIFSSIEGTRSILIEVQSLLLKTQYPSPKRTSVGLDSGRLSLIAAVLEARYGLSVNDFDIYISVAGGIKITEPAADLALAAALISSIKNKYSQHRNVFCGEVSLTGEVRPISHLEKRIQEAARLGFQKIFTPKLPQSLTGKVKDIEIKEITDLHELIKLI